MDCRLRMGVGLALFAYLFRLTRAVLDIRKQQKEILQLLRERRAGAEK